MPDMTDRDHFAAAALTGLLSQWKVTPGNQSPEMAALTVDSAYQLADDMLRERERTNLDAAQAARAAPSESSAPLGKGLGTGDTPEIAAYRRFVGEVMNWISEATGFMHDDVLRTDDARDIITDACSRCWDAFDRIAYPTVHGASPEARASVDSVAPQPTTRGESDRSDKAAPRPSEGTGDTPATHATPGEGSVPREGTQEPEAWAVCTPGDGDWSPCFFHEPHAQRCASAIFGSKNIVPLYRKPTLTDAEAETLRELRDEAAQYADEIGLCASEVRGRQRIIDGLLERLGGGR